MKNVLNSYAHKNSLLHRFPGLPKVIMAVLCVVFIAVLPGNSWYTYLGITCFLLSLTLMSRLSFFFLVKRLLFVEPFVLGIALLALWQENGHIIFTNMLIKSTLCLFTMILLSGTTRFSEILQALKTLHLPSLLITTLTLTYRYFYVLLDEMERLHQARRSRTFMKKKWHIWQGLGSIIALLFIRTSERAERVFNAMCARGWNP